MCANKQTTIQNKHEQIHSHNEPTQRNASDRDDERGKILATIRRNVLLPAKFQENTAMHFRVTVQKLNVTDGQTDGRVCFNISCPGPSARREIIKHPEMRVHIDDVMDVCLHIRNMHLGENPGNPHWCWWCRSDSWITYTYIIKLCWCWWLCACFTYTNIINICWCRW